MTKHSRLTPAELSTYRIPSGVHEALRDHGDRTGRAPAELAVLEWGCGRGRDTLRLRELGYDAFGVDIDPLPIRNGSELATAMGFGEGCLRVLDERGRSDFPDGRFDFAFSSQVLEHVADLDAVTAEIARLTKRGGAGRHELPAPYRPIEPHLFMPFVHWLPKGPMRRRLIALCVGAGVEPRWAELAGSSSRERAARYARYSEERTFYRTSGEIIARFRAAGLDARIVAQTHPSIERRGVPGRLHGSALRVLLATFTTIELAVEKP